MATRILTLSAFACLALAGPALAESSHECRGAWIKGHYYYECQDIVDTKYATTRSVCNSHFGCQTTIDKKPQPTPPKPYVYIPPSVERDPHTGVTVMRGMPER